MEVMIVSKLEIYTKEKSTKEKSTKDYIPQSERN